jgi:hypothetical protein
METTTSFDLNRAIQLWRENLAQSPAFRSENLNELESHLGDSIAAWQTHGLSAEEAFLIATRRIGKGGSLESEFGKVNKSAIWLDRLFWMVIGYQVWLLISGFVGLVTRNALFFGITGAGYDFKAHGYAIPVTLFALVQLAGFAGSLALCWWLLREKGQRLGRWLGERLRSRTTWILTFCVLFVLSIATGIANGGINALLINHFGRERIMDFVVSQGYSSAFIQLITSAVFTWLLLFLARKRLRLNQA